MDWTTLVLSLVTLILGGGWFVTYKAHKREKEGEAMQAEAHGAKAWQEVYQGAIEDANNRAENLRIDRDMLMTERNELREENKVMHKKQIEMEDAMNEIKRGHEEEMGLLKRELGRVERKVDSLVPVSCYRFDCQLRVKNNPNKKANKALKEQENE